MKRSNSQSGVALVITLILLSVITFMAVTFLVVSRREAAQVDVIGQQANAKFGAEAGAQQAMAQIAALMVANNNGLNGGLLVSTNYLSPYFDTASGKADSSITNVNYRDIHGNPLTGNDYLQMLTNLLILPRAPVFVTTNKAQPYSDFRYWLDLNRNGIYDTNGAVAELDAKGNPVVNSYVGDPEWVGILNHPEWPHSSSNYFVARYAFIALPIGNSLDIDFIHNQSQLGARWNDGYLRNQGVGSWELNLAGFLRDLNTNWYYRNNPNDVLVYNYIPIQPSGVPSLASGFCFDDAESILQYRNANNYLNLRTFGNLYGGSTFASANFTRDNIDGYSRGPVMTSFNFPILSTDPDNGALTTPWSGDYSTNQYFDTQDLFNLVPYYNGPTGNAQLSFSNFLYSIGRPPFASTNNNYVTNSFNRYTFYRMLSQMSFGSAPEPHGYAFAAGNDNFSSVYGNSPRMNLNYVNVGGVSATNFIPWAPAQFFTNAADRMLRAYFPNPIGVVNGKNVYLSITNIPVYPTNYYTPAVHRILQLAANMYDASTNRLFDSTANLAFPSVFKPYFAGDLKNGATNIYIAGYVEVGTDQNPRNIDMTTPKDFRRVADLTGFLKGGYTPTKPAYLNVYGVPYIIGARQGFPNFNRFAVQPIVTMSRKIELVKPSPNADPAAGGWLTNIQYNLGISNVFSADCWYSYTNLQYSRGIAFYVTNDLTIYFTNNLGIVVPPIVTQIGSFNISTPNTASAWPGSINLYTQGPNSVNSNAFKVPIFSNVVVMPDSVLRLNPMKLVPDTNYTGFSVSPDTYNNGNGYLVPRWGMNITNRVRLMMVDVGTGRLIDYVQFQGGQLDGTLDIVADLQTVQSNLWSTNAAFPARNIFTPKGIYNQIAVSLGPTLPSPDVWANIPLAPGQSRQDEINAFGNFIRGDGTLKHQVPFVALTKYSKTFKLEVNDPLIHYTVSDLTDATTTYPPNPYLFTMGVTNALSGVMRVVSTNHYQPWGFTSSSPKFSDIKTNQVGYKDPLQSGSDMWQFPTNKYPNIGWLGRVHRGTPWQTVFLKSAGVNPTNWMYWTGNTTVNYYTNGYWMGSTFSSPTGTNDSLVSQPSSDYILMDLFTTAVNDNASKGQLSINQPGQAAWAAVLDGVITVVNTNTPPYYTPHVIDPSDKLNGGATNTVQYLVDSINFTRSNQYNGTFTSLGQICSVPQLTLANPYLNTSGAAASVLNDEAYERIPQQIMSLLRLGSPRYVIFAYGQSLKPANHSIVQSGQYFGMCTNYQITGEVATRTVVRFDNYPVPGSGKVLTPRAVVESFNVLQPQ